MTGKMAATAVVRVCESINCTKEAKLQCPTCIKLGIEGSFFCEQGSLNETILIASLERPVQDCNWSSHLFDCNQETDFQMQITASHNLHVSECFKESWKEHKQVHKKERMKINMKAQSEAAVSYNPWPGYVFSGPLRPFPKSNLRVVPEDIARPDYADHPAGYPASEMEIRGSTQIKVLSKDEIEGLRIACKYGREVLDVAAAMIRPGVTTDEIDEAVHQASIERKCYPSPLNYNGFPKSCCTSVNEVICHGIPDKRPLEEGDIVNVDITVFHNGYHGDLNETFFVGKVDDKSRELVETTYEAMKEAINMVKPGVRYRDVGNVIQKKVQAHGFSVVRTYCGHGIHRLFHTTPSIPHYSKNKAIGVMKPGHAFTIEPMINMGRWQDSLWPDDWTAVTVDGKRSAQFEHTLIVTETGCDVLTARQDKDGRPHFLDQLEKL